jgi:hypothetical protein
VFARKERVLGRSYLQHGGMEFGSAGLMLEEHLGQHEILPGEKTDVC